MSIMILWFLLALSILTRIQAQADCSHPYSEQEIESCIEESVNPLGPKPQDPDPDPAAPGNLPPEASPTSKPAQQGKPPPQNPSPSTTPIAEPPTVTRTSQGNPSTQQLTAASSEIRSQSNLSPSATISVPATLSTEYGMPTSISSTPPDSPSAIASPGPGRTNGNGTHVAVGLIVGIVTSILVLIIVVFILLYRRRRACRTPTAVDDHVSRLSLPPEETAASAAAVLPYSSLRSPTCFSAEKDTHTFISMPTHDGGETDLETYDPPSTLRALSFPAYPDQHLELGDRIREPNSRRISEGRLRSFIMDRYGAFPATGRSPVETDDELPPYLPSD